MQPRLLAFSSFENWIAEVLVSFQNEGSLQRCVVVFFSDILLSKKQSRYDPRPDFDCYNAFLSMEMFPTRTLGSLRDHDDDTKDNVN